VLDWVLLDGAESRNDCMGKDWRLRYAADGMLEALLSFSSMPSRQNQWYKALVSCFWYLIALLVLTRPVGLSCQR